MNTECSPSDKQLIEQCRNGDEEAFEKLYYRYRRQLYAYLNGFFPNRTALADDIFQQTWLRVLDNIGTYRHRQKFLSWLFRIAHNLATDHWRREARRPVTELDDTVPGETDAPWEEMDRKDRDRAVQRAISELPDAQREVVLLRQRDVSFKDIADIQQVSINTVLGRMHYAVRKIQQQLRDWM